MTGVLAAALTLRLFHGGGDLGETATFEIGREQVVEAVLKSRACEVWDFELPGVDLDKGCVVVRARVWNEETPSPWSKPKVYCSEPDKGGWAAMMMLAWLMRRRRC